MDRLFVACCSLVCSVTALARTAAAEPPASDVRLDVKAESHSTVMTAPLQGVFLGVSRALGDADLHPRVWIAGGGLIGLESTGVAGEVGASMSYYGAGRSEGLGGTVDAGFSLLRLHQGHDRELLLAGAVIVEPALVFTRGRFTALAGVRLKDVVYERLTFELDDRTTVDTSAWKLETGLKAGVRFAF